MWLYFRFTLSFRDIEELLAARGVVVTYEAVRQWCLKFGQQYAKEIRRRRPRPRLSHKNLTCLSKASNLLGQSAKFSIASWKLPTLSLRNNRMAKLRKQPIIWA